MCSYCGCDSITVIGRFMEEHVEIINASGALRRAVAGDGDVAVAAEQLGALLHPHTATEEAGLFTVMKGLDEYHDHIETLCGEHRTLDDLLASAPEGRLVHEDLHDENALAPLDPTRGGWLAIDPKPVVGEWEYAVAPVVWNRFEEAAKAHNLRAHVRLRADVVADAAGLDLDRTYAWTFIRLVLNAVWATEYLLGSSDFLGRMITLAKAFADPPDW